MPRSPFARVSALQGCTYIVLPVHYKASYVPVEMQTRMRSQKTKGDQKETPLPIAGLQNSMEMVE